MSLPGIAADPVLPKGVLLVSQWLCSIEAVVDVIEDRKPSYRLGATYPQIRLVDVGPMERCAGEVKRRIQVECWAEDYDTAEDLALVIEAEIPTIRGQWPAGYCAGGGVESGPRSSPDDQAKKFRHLLDLGVWLYPNQEE